MQTKKEAGILINNSSPHKIVISLFYTTGTKNAWHVRKGKRKRKHHTCSYYSPWGDLFRPLGPR